MKTTLSALLVLGLLVAFMANNLLTAMDRRGLGFGFSFLGRQAGFEIAGLYPVSRQTRTGRVLEYDCVMVRAKVLKKRRKAR